MIKRFPPLPKRAGYNYTIEEDIKIANLYGKGLTNEQIAKEMKRTPSGICGRLCHLRATIRAAEQLPITHIKKQIELGHRLRKNVV